MVDRSLSSIFFSCFWILFDEMSSPPPFLQDRPEKFSMLAKRGELALFEFFWVGVSKKGGVDFYRGGPEDFLKVIFNC